MLASVGRDCPENFEGRAALVGAEIARIEGRELDAQHLYEQAIRRPAQTRFVHNEALAYELAARFYAGRGFERSRASICETPGAAISSWGADGKVRQLDAAASAAESEEAAQPAPRAPSARPSNTSTSRPSLRVSQAVSGEFVLDKLIDKLMRTALEHAGAQRGLLIDSREGVLRLEAQAVTSGNDIIVHRRGIRSRRLGYQIDRQLRPAHSRSRDPRHPPSVRARFLTMSTSATRMSARYSACR